MLTSIVGINWGDEGKGRMVDLLSQKYDVVVRYQGGNNAGHTVINDKGKFVLNLMPSGILRDETVNVLGPGMVIDTEHMFHEVEPSAHTVRWMLSFNTSEEQVRAFAKAIGALA